MKKTCLFLGTAVLLSSHYSFADSTMEARKEKAIQNVEQLEKSEQVIEENEPIQKEEAEEQSEMSHPRNRINPSAHPSLFEEMEQDKDLGESRQEEEVREE